MTDTIDRTFAVSAPTDTELLKYVTANPDECLQYRNPDGSIDLDGVADDMKKKEKIRIIDHNHPYKIFQDKDGRWKTYIKDEKRKGGRKLIAKATREKLEDTLVEIYKSQDAKYILDHTTLEMLYPHWLEHKRLHTNAESYIRRIERDWKSYYEGTAIARRPLRSLTSLELDEWAHSLIKECEMTAKQYYNCTVIMRQALKYALKKGIIEVNPFSAVEIDGRRMFRHMKKPESETQVFSETELRTLEEYAWNDFNNCAKSRVHKLAPLAILFQFQTGTRIGEVLGLRFEDITEDGKWLHVQRFYRYEMNEIAEHTKGSEGDRFLPLTSQAQKIIAVAREKRKELGLPEDGYIFSVNEKPLSYAAISYLYSKYCDRLETVHKSSHKARKTVISTLIDAGININSIREYVGHADEQTTLRNYCFDRRSQEERAAQVEKALVQ